MPAERTSSYVASEMPEGLTKELERLRSQVHLTWDKETRNLEWWGLRDGMSVLELGSGPGFVTEGLLQMLPTSTVTALEIDPVLIEKAQNYLQGREESRWKIVQGDIMHIDLPDNSFDFAYGRYLFQHLPDPVGAAKEVMRVLKPGGMLVITDVDDDLTIIDPTVPPEAEAISQRTQKSYQTEQASKGGNRLIGRRLPGLLRDAGYQHLDIDGIAAHSQLVDMSVVIPMLTLESLRMFIDKDVITQQEAETLVKAADDFEASDHVILIFLIMACGQKPTPSAD